MFAATLSVESNSVLAVVLLGAIAARGSFLDSHLEQQTVEAKALKKGRCWLRILTAIKEACSTLEPSTQASLALQLLNCHLESMAVKEIRCGEPVTECAAFKEIAESPKLLTVYAQFYVLVLTTCAFTQFHSEQERLLRIAKNVSESIQQTSADAMKLAEKARDATARRNRISELQQQTMTTQAGVRELVESDHLFQIRSLVDDLKRFLRATSYAVRLAVESMSIFAIVVCVTLRRVFPSARHPLLLLCVIKFLFERQLLEVIVKHDLPVDTLMPQLLKVSRSLFLLVMLREIYITRFTEAGSRHLNYDVLEEQLAEIRARIGLQSPAEMSSSL